MLHELAAVEKALQCKRILLLIQKPVALSYATGFCILIAQSGIIAIFSTAQFVDVVPLLPIL